MCAGHKTGNIEEFNRDGAATFYTGTVVGFAFVGETEACAGAFYLKVADGTLWVDRCEAIRTSDRGFLRAKALQKLYVVMPGGI